MDIWSRLLSHRVLLASYKVVIFTQLCDDSRKPFSLSLNLWLTAIIWWQVFVGKLPCVCTSLSSSPLTLSPCPRLKCWSQMQLASQKGQKTCGHRVSGSCHGRLSWGCLSSRAVWVSWQKKGWKDSEIESARGSTSVPTVVGMHKTLTSEVAKTTTLLYPCMFFTCVESRRVYRRSLLLPECTCWHISCPAASNPGWHGVITTEMERQAGSLLQSPQFAQRSERRRGTFEVAPAH